MIYNEELVIVAPPGHPPIRAPRDAKPCTMLAFEYGCSYRARMEQWFAMSGQTPEKIIEMMSWHAIIGCTAAGMGVSVLPRMVIESFPETNCTIHPLPSGLNHTPTMLFWRKGAMSPNVRALRDVLLERAVPAPKKAAKRARA